MSNPITEFAGFIAAEFAKAEEAVGPSLGSVGAMLLKLEQTVQGAIAKSTNAQQVEAIVDPVIQVLIGSLSAPLGPQATAFLEQLIVSGVNDLIEKELPAPVAVAAKVEAS